MVFTRGRLSFLFPHPCDKPPTIRFLLPHPCSKSSTIRFLLLHPCSKLSTIRFLFLHSCGKPSTTRFLLPHPCSKPSTIRFCFHIKGGSNCLQTILSAPGVEAFDVEQSLPHRVRNLIIRGL